MADILIYKGSYQYDAVNLFAEELGEGFRRLGKDAVFADLKSPELLRDLQRELSKPLEFIVSFGGAGADFKLGDKNLYEQLPYPFVALMVDHPGHFINRLRFKNMIVTCMDRSHLLFMRDYFGESKKAAFLPHGGSYADASAEKKDKTIDILFAATYFDTNMYYEKIKSMPEIPQRFVLELTESILAANSPPIELEIIKLAARYNIDLNTNKAFHRKFLEDIVAIVEIFVRARKRDIMVAALDKCPFKTHIFGNNWPKTDFKNIVVHPPLKFKDTLNLMRESKMVLNLSCLADGSHERVPSAMLNGSVSLSDWNPYLGETFRHMENIVLYKWLEMESLPDMLGRLLSDRDKLESIGAAGYKTASEKHTWANRASELLNIVNNFKKVL